MKILILLFIAVLNQSLVGCRVESDRVPVAREIYTSDDVKKARKEVRSRLAELNASTAVIGRMQNLLNRSLQQNGVSSADSAPSISNYLAPTEADDLILDSESPDTFSYTLNNSSAYSLQTRSGGQVSFVLSGTLFRSGDDISINNAKLDVVHTTSNNRQKFHILAETRLEENGEQVSDWSIDFNQINSFYASAEVADENSFLLEGVLSVRISKSRTDISATKISQRAGDVEVVFEKLKIHMTHSPDRLAEVVISGHVNKKRSRVGEFSMENANDGETSGLNLSIDLH